MKKLLFIFLLFGYIAQGQVYTPQTAAGYQFKRIKGDSTVYIPTFCGIPNLRSINPQLQGGIALDSCNNLFYYYSPKTKQWYSLPQISQITVIDSTSIQICNFNSCDTFLTTVNPQNVRILNDSTLLVCANTDPPECDTLDVGRRQFVNNLFDTTTIYQTIQNFIINNDSVLNTKMDKQILVDTVYTYWIGDTARVQCVLYTNDSLRCDTTVLLTPTNIRIYSDTIPDTAFMVSHQTIDGNNILYATQDPNSDNDSIHVNLYPEGHAGQVLGSTGTGVAWVSQNDHHANQLVYGGIVTWLHDYVYNVSPSGYYINDVFYESPSTDITLDAADATNDRIDLFVLTTSSTATDITGTPAGTPVAPDYDANTQLQISFAIVYAGTTEPPATNEWIYKENTEWTTAASVGSINPNSTNNPFAGSKDVEGTNVGNAAYITFSSPVSTVDFSKYNFLTFQIRSKGNFATTKKLVFTWFRAPSNATGNNVPIGSGSYGFISTMTASYQTISIPLSDFGNISTANILRITESNTSGTAGWYIDNIQLQYIPVTTPSNDVVFYGKNATGDSTILLLKNGSRSAAKDSTGGGGGNDSAYVSMTSTDSSFTLTRDNGGTSSVIFRFPTTDTTSLSDRINLKQNQLNGTGFVKASGTTISYDNSTYEPALGNPASDGYVLSSTAAGVRSWVAQSGGGGGGSVTSVSDLSPLFTTTDPTTTPTFVLSNTSQYKVFGRKASGGGVPSYVDADSSLIIDLHSQGYYDGRYARIANYGQWSINGPKIFVGTSPSVITKVGIGPDTPFAQLHIAVDDIRVTQVDSSGLYLQNRTASTSGITRQYSPQLFFGGSYWTGSVNRPEKVRMYVYPGNTDGGITANPALFIDGTNAGGAYALMAKIQQGQIITGSSIFGNVTSIANSMNTPIITSTNIINAKAILVSTTNPASVGYGYGLSDTYSTASLSKNLVQISPTFNYTSGTQTQRGFYYNPTLTSVTGLTNIAFENTSGNALFGTTTGNIALGGSTFGTSANHALAIFNGTVPSSSVTDGVQLYAEDVSSSSELKVRDEAGNITTLSPHNFSRIPGGKSNPLAWSFYSERNGQYVNADMYKALETIENQSKEIEELKVAIAELKKEVYKKKQPVKLIYTGKK